MKLFGRSTKTPSEMTKALKDALLSIEVDKKDRRRGSEDAGKHLMAIKMMIQSNEGQESAIEINSQLLTEFMKGDIARHIIKNLIWLDFESRKDAVLILGSMLRRQHGIRWPMAEHLAEYPEVFDVLVNYYEWSELCSAVGTILRDSIRHERLASMLLESRAFWTFFKLVQGKRFDIAGDSFLTFKELLTRHKALVSHFINQNYDFFFEHLNGLLASDNYVAKRQSIRLLGELLINRLNFSAMIRYTSNSGNLKLVMNLLSEQSRAIQFEAFHVFKVFIANPEKNQDILAILTRNRTKLLGFLQNFCNERDKDDQFNDEKDYVMRQINSLPSHDSIRPMSPGDLMQDEEELPISPLRHSLLEQPRAFA